MADVIVIAGELIPGMLDGSLSYADILRAIDGVHSCHVMAFALQLAHEYANRGLSQRDTRMFPVVAEINQVGS